MTNFPKPKEGIMNINPYKGGESKLQGINRIIKLASNENAFGTSPKAIKAINNTVKEVFRYPDGSCNDLRKTLAQKHQINFDKIVCGAGSDELIGLLCQAYAGIGDEVLYNDYGFLMYSIRAKSFGAAPVTAPEKNLTADLDALLAAITSKTKIIFLANPNNPTGTMLPKHEIRRLAQNIPSNVLLVLDAAYAEFIDDVNYSSGLELVEEFKNVAVLRTFSKIYGLGGLRLGFCYCPEAVADVLNRIRGPFNVSSLAQTAGLAALDDDEFVNKTKKHNQRWLEKLPVILNSMSIKTTKSFGNFVLAEFPEGQKSAANADNYLRQHGLIVRPMGAYKLPNHLRISIGLDDEMELLIKVLNQFMNNG